MSSEIIDTARLLQNILDTEENPEVRTLRQGSFSIEEETLNDPAEVIARFKKFGGEGWFCTSESPKVYILPGELPVDEYPLHGESASGMDSLHLRQNGQGGWVITTLTEDNSIPTEDLLYETILQTRGETSNLRYVVHCSLLGSSLRPQTARFAGFAD